MSSKDITKHIRQRQACDKHLKEISGIADKVVVSVSSGKTSTYLALNKNPEDKRPYYYQFAVVLTSDKKARPKDKGLLRECQNKIPWFEASHEVDESLKIILQLEQELNKEIRWVASHLTLENLINEKRILPDRSKRFCTQYLKYEPQSWDTYLNLSDGLKFDDNSFIPNPLSIEMQIGFRWDERKRVFNALGFEENKSCLDSFKFAQSCDLLGQFSGNHRWKQTEWRLRTFPLYSRRVTIEHILEYWQKRNWDYKFPKISNCSFCFHKNKKELQEQANHYPERLPNWIEQETKTGHTFNKNGSMKDIIFGDIQIKSDQMPCLCTD